MVEEMPSLSLEALTEMKRLGHLGEIEYKYSLALNCPNFCVNEDSSYYQCILEYMNSFRRDVVTDMRPYLKIMTQSEILALDNFITTKLEQIMNQLTKMKQINTNF